MEATVAPPSRPPRRRGALIACTSAGLAGLALAFWLWQAFGDLAPRTSTPALLPAPPSSGAPTALAEHLRGAYARALAEPGAVGSLGLAYHSGDLYEEAAICYALAEARDPGEWRWSYLRALIHDELGVPQAAAEALERVVALQPGFALAWLRLGDAASKRGRIAEAEAHYRRCIEADRASPDRAAQAPPAPAPGAATIPSETDPSGRTFPIAAYASLGMARVLIERGALDGAAGILERVAAEQPAFGPAHRLLGSILERLGREKEAAVRIAMASYCAPYLPPADPFIDELARESRSSTFLLKQHGVALHARNQPWAEFLARRAIEVHPGDPDAVAAMAQLLLKTGRASEAVPLVRRYRIMAPDDHRTLTKIGHGLALGGRREEGLECLRDAVRMAPRYMEAHNRLAYVHACLGEMEEAVRLCRAALEIDPEDVSTHTNLASYLTDLERTDEALAHAREAIRLRENFAEAHHELGRIFLRKGDLPEARRHLEHALAVRPDYAEAHNTLYTLLARIGRHEEGSRHLELAIAADPTHADASNNLAMLLLAAGSDLRRARGLLERAVQSDPRNAEAHNNLAAAILASGGDPDAAQRHLEVSIRLRPRDFQTRDNLACLLERRGRWREALAEFEKALEIRPEAVRPMGNLARLLATCPRDGIRDGPRALRLAERACELAASPDPRLLDALAAAAAETGDFARAAETIRGALPLARAPSLTGLETALKARLELYLRGQPYRQAEPTGR